MNKIILLLAVALIFSGCTTLQYESVVKDKDELAGYVWLEDVPFEDQADYHCGPAVMSMAMQYIGRPLTPDTLSEQMFTPAVNGSMQADVIGTARRNGAVAIPVYDFRSMLKELDAGHPVMVFENVGLSVFPQWHYALVVGYDLANQEVILHTGHDVFKPQDMRVFENSWKLADYWGLVVLRPGDYAASAGEKEHIKAAVGLQQAQNNFEAEQTYKSILKRWPDSVVSLIGIANIEYEKKNYVEAVKNLKAALKIQPDSQAAQHNLSIVTKSELEAEAPKKEVVR